MRRVIRTKAQSAHSLRMANARMLERMFRPAGKPVHGRSHDYVGKVAMLPKSKKSESSE